MSVAALGLALSTGVGVADADPLAPHRWAHRVLLLLQGGGAHPDQERLRQALRRSDCEVQARHMVVGEFPPGAPGKLGTRMLTIEDALGLRRRLGLARDDAAVVLIGKDGGIKLLESAAPTLAAIFDLIDGMPMRRSEMARIPTPCADRG